MNDKNYLYTITNVKNKMLMLTYSILENKFLLLDKNKIVINDSFINKFELHYINTNKYKLVYKYNDKTYKKNIKLIFSSNKLHNPLFFNIYIETNNNTYKILKSNCKDILCNSHYILYENTTITKFIKKSSYVFFLNYNELQPCRIRLNDELYNVYGYTKTPVLNKTNNKYNITCNVNRDLHNSYKVNYNKDCRYLKFKDNVYNKDLEKCSVNKKSNFLLNKLPNLGEILKQLVKKQSITKAGNQQDKLNKVKESIDAKIGDEKTREEIDKLEKTIDPEYKPVLTNILEKFDKLNPAQLTKGTYIELIKNIHENNKEYSLIGKYKMCSGVKLTNICNVENVVDCQNKCNEIYDCAHLSYDRKKKVCKIFNTCGKLKDNYYNFTYSKNSLLRNNGYNLFNAFLLYKNIPIPEVPTVIKLLIFASGTIIIVCCSMIIYKIVKALFKLVLCVYYDNCYSPLVLLNVFSSEGPSQRYI
tara:strand:- start:8988 stop:10409 length:1422 start_codon:yes stop_codon:yes gene_type:complete